MNRLPIHTAPAVIDSEWVPFPGGELEGKRPRALCPDCRRARQGASTSRVSRPALCFQCYRLELERTRALEAAGTLDTASEARFQALLPFAPVNRPLLTRLEAERQAAKTAARSGAGAYIEKRRRAQIEARHALAHVVRGIRERQVAAASSSRDRQLQAASEVGLSAYPASWLPFVAAR